MAMSANRAKSAAMAVAMGAGLAACHIYVNEPRTAPTNAPVAPPAVAAKPAASPAAAPAPTHGRISLTPRAGAPAASAAATAAATTAPTGSVAPASTVVPAATAFPVPVGGMLVVDGKPVPTVAQPTPFGSGDATGAALLGLVYFVGDDTKKLPDVSALVPTGALFARELAVSAREFKDGFPGVDPRSEWFVLRYTGKTSVAKAGEYGLRLVSGDGAIVRIDEKVVVDNDGVHAPSEKKAKVTLTAGEHALRVDYLRASGTPAALQLFVTAPGGVEKPWAPAL